MRRNPAKPKRKSTRKSKSEAKSSPSEEGGAQDAEKSSAAEEPEQPAEPEGPPADHVVHLYEHGKFTRTVQREFTEDDAEAFATEFNRTSASHGRHAVAASKDAAPAPTV